MKRVFAILTALVLLSASACSLRKKPTGEDYYAQGQSNFQDHEYKAAVENYQKLIDEYPFSPYEEDAELKIGLAYYQEKEYAEAIAALDDFQRMHPTSKKLDLVTYYIAMSYYDQIGREDQDQSKTAAALKRFEEIEQRFPEGSFDELAREHVAVCREMLARHDMVVGNFYYKRANFRAAESRFAELMQKYPDTPVAPDALWELGVALEKEGKKYSAAQAFAALEKHYPHTPYGPKARVEMRKLHQAIDTEEDPLPMVLAETGYPSTPADGADGVTVRQRGSDLASSGSSSSTLYGEDGLPIITASNDKHSGTASDAGGSFGGAASAGLPAGASAPAAGGVASALAASGAAAGGSSQAPSASGVASKIASAALPSFSPPPPAAAPAAGSGEEFGAAFQQRPPAPAPRDSGSMVPGGDMMALNTANAAPPPGGSLPTQVSPSSRPPAETADSSASPSYGSGSSRSSELQPARPIQSDTAPGSMSALANAPAPEAGPATLKTIRLSSNDPPLTVIFDLTGPVNFEKSIEQNSDGAIVTVVLKDVKPDASIASHVAFNRSIFKDCEITRDSDKTTITLNMQPIISYSVVPLEDPARLLVTFTPQNPPGSEKTSANN